jgi:hypothetical protein
MTNATAQEQFPAPYTRFSDWTPGTTIINAQSAFDSAHWFSFGGTKEGRNGKYQYYIRDFNQG